MAGSCGAYSDDDPSRCSGIVVRSVHRRHTGYRRAAGNRVIHFERAVNVRYALVRWKSMNYSASVTFLLPMAFVFFSTVECYSRLETESVCYFTRC